MRKNGIEKQKLGYEYIFNKWDRVEIHGPFIMQKIKGGGYDHGRKKAKAYSDKEAGR